VSNSSIVVLDLLAAFACHQIMLVYGIYILSSMLLMKWSTEHVDELEHRYLSAWPGEAEN